MLRILSFSKWLIVLKRLEGLLAPPPPPLISSSLCRYSVGFKSVVTKQISSQKFNHISQFHICYHFIYYWFIVSMSPVLIHNVTSDKKQFNQGLSNNWLFICSTIPHYKLRDNLSDVFACILLIWDVVRLQDKKKDSCKLNYLKHPYFQNEIFFTFESKKMHLVCFL